MVRFFQNIFENVYIKCIKYICLKIQCEADIIIVTILQHLAIKENYLISKFKILRLTIDFCIFDL